MKESAYLRGISITILVLSVALWATIIIPSMIAKNKQVSQESTEQVWEESPRTLTAIEQATMSADFSQDFEQNLVLANATPTPSPIFSLDVPASMAGDLIPPTVTIQGGVTEGATISQTSLCFPLWLSDNMTPWQQLTTRAKMDNAQWSVWMPLTQYCFQNIGNGTHVFTVQIRDLVGNVSQELKRTFSVKQ